MTDQTHCGFVSLIGAPNAGKSTLINHLVGAKVSIVTHKVQTTRYRILGIAMHEQDDQISQIVFVDTPGIFQAKQKYDRAMVDAAWQGAQDGDIICLLVDTAKKNVSDDTLHIIKQLKKQQKQAVLILNKVDIADKPGLLALTEHLNTIGDFKQTFMISAKTGSGTQDLMNFLAQNMPAGPFLYDPDTVTDMPLRLFAAEITREKLFLQLQEELPYALTVETDQWEEFKNGDIKISQVIYVMRDTQKAIVLGKSGQRIKTIGKAVRHELSDLLSAKVHLNLFVKVRKNWAENPDHYTQWGLDFQKDR